MKSHSANTMTQSPGLFTEDEVVRLFERGPAFHETRWPNNGFTTNTLATWPLLTSLHHVPLWTILITSSQRRLGRPCGLPSSPSFYFTIHALDMSHFAHACHASIYGEEYAIQTVFLCNVPQVFVNSAPPPPPRCSGTFLRNSFWNTLEVCSSLKLKNEVSDTNG